MRKFKVNDKVIVRDCEELEMPCTVVGPDEWMPSVTRGDGSEMLLYKIIGKHTKRGNMVSVRVAEEQLTHAPSSDTV